MKVLFLSSWFPYPTTNGSKMRIYNLLRGLSTRHEIHLLSFSDQGTSIDQSTDLFRYCNSIKCLPAPIYHPGGQRALLGILGPRPRYIVDTYSSQMYLEIQNFIEHNKPDLVIVSELPMASYWNAFAGVPAILEDLEIGAFASQRSAAKGLQRLRLELTKVKLHKYLSHLLPHFTACTVVSQQECHLVRKLAPDNQRLEIIPNCVNLTDYQDIVADPMKDTLIFSGSFSYDANYDAAAWFVSEVFPIIRENSPDARLLITGDHANLPLSSIKNIVMTGFVDDVRPLVAGSTVSVVPLRIGGGTRLKILEAMALGTPVVSTSKGAEGLSIRNGEDLLIGDNPRDFAQAVLNLMHNPDLCSQIAGNGRELVRQKYDWNVVMPTFLALVENAVARPSI